MTPAAGPFSQPSRLELIDEYFADRTVEPTEAWKDVYRLLLWSDVTTGLAHCYESDKSQPGRPWYGRTLAFHDWLAQQFGVSDAELPEHLDFMFRRVMERVTAEEGSKAESLAKRALAQRSQYSESMPAPGDDPELRELIEPLLDPRAPVSEDVVREVLQLIHTYIASENKRKNLLGRGFEDVLSGVIRRLPGGGPQNIGTQVAIEDVPGFRPPRTGDKSEKVDLWVGPADGRRILVSAKWSVRADREKQLRGDFLTYVAANERREPFEFVWLTNEFDPARLVANASNTEGNQYLLDRVVHICPEALRVVHTLNEPKLFRTNLQLREHLDSGRIVSLAEWLTTL